MTKDQINRVQFEGFEWIDFCNPANKILKEFAEANKLNYFQVQDALQVGHLPKYEIHENYKFIIMRAFSAKMQQRVTNINELSNKIAFFYNHEKIITIHRTHFSFLDKPAAADSPEHLMLMIVEQMVRTYDPPARFLAEELDKMEQVIFLGRFGRVSLEELYYHKAHSRISRKLLHFTNHVLSQISVTENHTPYLQSIKEGVQELMLAYEEVTDDSFNLLNTYLSVGAQKNNDTMRLLTIFSAFFLPLTFIVGVYGMNFQNMPELKWRYGYFIILGVMSVVVIGVLIWFRRKKII
jgi:magnesium transporter